MAEKWAHDPWKDSEVVEPAGGFKEEPKIMNTLPQLNGPVSIESYADNLKAKLEVASILLRSGMAPQHYKTPEQVLGAVLYGRELGFSPIRALQAIDVIQGKPTLSAAGLKALAIQHGGQFKTVEWDEKVCTLEISRGDWKENVTFTWAEAERAGLTTKDNWKRMPKPMLYARCVSTGIRNMFTDVIGGLYSSEEMRDVTPVVREVPQARKPVFPTVDETTGEVIDDDLPASFTKPMTLVEMKAAVQAMNWGAIGSHKIQTKCSLQRRGLTIRQAMLEDEKTIQEHFDDFDEIDRMAFEAYAMTLAEEKQK